MSTFVAILSGCTIGGKSFSIDSNSRIPFFGLELKERKPKSIAPVYQSIARTNADTSEIKVALQIGHSTPGNALNKRAKRLASTSVPGIDLVSDRVPATHLNPNDGIAQTIPLPRTDETQRRVDRQSSPRNVDFQ
jgi:hypothetical protein